MSKPSKLVHETSDDPEGLTVGKSKYVVGKFIAGGQCLDFLVYFAH